MQKTEVTEEFLDTYEGEVLFLSQDLEEIVTSMKQDSFNEETLTLLTQKINEVSDVFLSSRYTQHVAPLFKDFAAFILSLDFLQLSQKEEALTYLSEIITDVDTYINFYFVERSFSDVYLFQDSLENSIDFLKRSYQTDTENSIEDDGSELDFF